VNLCSTKYGVKEIRQWSYRTVDFPKVMLPIAHHTKGVATVALLASTAPTPMATKPIRQGTLFCIVSHTLEMHQPEKSPSNGS